jgi:para-aminobenzoate synthetase/4-amino-4-deoxychorismate lyase
LWNASGEITEASSANIIIKSEGGLLTPPVTSGLLPGTFRDQLLAEKKIREHVITIEDLWQSEAIYLINSVRKWREAKLIPLGV